MKTITLSWIFVCAFGVMAFSQSKDDLVSILNILAKQEATQAFFQTPSNYGNAMVIESRIYDSVESRTYSPAMKTFNELTKEDCRKVGKPILFMTEAEMKSNSILAKNTVQVRIRTAKNKLNITFSTHLGEEKKMYLTDYIMIKDGLGNWAIENERVYYK